MTERPLEAILADMDRQHFIDKRRGVYDELERRVREREEAGEFVGGIWIMDMLRRIQVEKGTVKPRG